MRLEALPFDSEEGRVATQSAANDAKRNGQDTTAYGMRQCRAVSEADSATGAENLHEN